jgi:mRNA-degrading endonuclease RelE of RelBE toxin-antitoxin system
VIIEQTVHFQRTIKKFKKNQKTALDSAVKIIINDPEIGDLKVGDLSGVRVYKYKMVSSQYLLAYVYDEVINKITLLAIGVHENFYRDLKKRL